MTKKYKPIACRFYDELEFRALRKSKVILSYKDDKDAVVSLECVVADLFSKDKIEYLKTDKGRLIRLDDIIGLDGIFINMSC